MTCPQMALEIAFPLIMCFTTFSAYTTSKIEQDHFCHQITNTPKGAHLNMKPSKSENYFFKVISSWFTTKSMAFQNSGWSKVITDVTFNIEDIQEIVLGFKSMIGRKRIDDLPG